ncbi:hypothetical protein ACTFIV_009908 [Dictyostelium citrinum]
MSLIQKLFIICIKWPNCYIPLKKLKNKVENLAQNFKPRNLVKKTDIAKVNVTAQDVVNSATNLDLYTGYLVSICNNKISESYRVYKPRVSILTHNDTGNIFEYYHCNHTNWFYLYEFFLFGKLGKKLSIYEVLIYLAQDLTNSKKSSNYQKNGCSLNSIVFPKRNIQREVISFHEGQFKAPSKTLIHLIQRSIFSRPVVESFITFSKMQHNNQFNINTKKREINTN